MDNKESKIKNIIESNPNLSGNKLYILSKEKGIGIRKTDFYKLVREVRALPEPTIEKKEASIPKKYRVIVKPDKSGKYGIVEIIDDKTNESKWIKYISMKDYKNQLNTIIAEYSIVSYTSKFHGFRKLKSFVAKEFKQFLENEGVVI